MGILPVSEVTGVIGGAEESCSSHRERERGERIERETERGEDRKRQTERERALLHTSFSTSVRQPQTAWISGPSASLSTHHSHLSQAIQHSTPTYSLSHTRAHLQLDRHHIRAKQISSLFKFN